MKTSGQERVFCWVLRNDFFSLSLVCPVVAHELSLLFFQASNAVGRMGDEI
jgi:hypothetical protein